MPHNSTPPTFWREMARGMVLRKLADWEQGTLLLKEGTRTTRIGNGAGPVIEVEIRHQRFFQRLLTSGSLGVAESYLDEDWDCEHLTDLIRLVLQNRSFSNSLGKGWARVGAFFSSLMHQLRPNTRRGSRKNIQAHYDLGNDLFALMLDDTWAYSSAIFSSPETSLRNGSIEKIDRACRKLDLQPGDELLEIGSGWGGLAIHAAQHYGCHVTTTTISDQQYALAKERIAASGLESRIRLLKQDYRDLTGTYDKLVSIEMIEAVGHRFLGTYLSTCSRLLKPEGSLLIQGILMSEQHHADYVGSVDFIQKYVFPGGCLPSIHSISEAIARHTDFRWAHFEDFAPHYAQTLRFWRANIQRELESIRSLGYSERFLRIWNYYLCYCEAAFEERYLGLGQWVFDKPGCRRDPMLLSERAVRPTRGLERPPEREQIRTGELSTATPN